MYIQIMTIAAEGITMEEREVLCDACAAACNRLAGVQATEWSVNNATNTVCGLVRWTEQQAIAEGTETLQMRVASLRNADRILRCREFACTVEHPPIRHDSRSKPNTGFVHERPEYDPRG